MSLYPKLKLDYIDVIALVISKLYPWSICSNKSPDGFECIGRFCSQAKVNDLPIHKVYLLISVDTVADAAAAAAAAAVSAQQ